MWCQGRDLVHARQAPYQLSYQYTLNFESWTIYVRYKILFSCEDLMWQFSPRAQHVLTLDVFLSLTSQMKWSGFTFGFLFNESWYLLQTTQIYVTFPLPAVIINTLVSKPGVHDPLAFGACSAVQSSFFPCLLGFLLYLPSQPFQT